MDKNVETPKPSVKRNIAAAVTTAAVTVVLTVAAQAAIDVVTKKIHDKVNPETEDK